MNKMILQLISAKNKTLLGFLFVLASSYCSVSYSQTNVALSASASHSGGGAGAFLGTNYNDGIITANTAECEAPTQPWGWVTTNGWIRFDWCSDMTFDKIVLYKSNRPMTSCTMEYWDGTTFVPFLSYTGSTCSEDSVTFPPVTTSILRFSSVAGSSNPNHREIQIWSSAETPCTTPVSQPTALTFTPGVYTVTGSFAPAVPAPQRYLVVMTTTPAPPVDPVDGIEYCTGSTALGGTIISSGVATNFVANGLAPGTTYWFWVYSYNSYCTGGPKYLTVAPLTGSVTTNSCTLSGIRTVGPTGDFPTVAAALAAINSLGVAGPMALELQTTYAGEPLPITIGELPCVNAVNTITIRPQGVMNLSLPAGADMIILDGAKHVIIDGRVGSTGTTKALTIGNQSSTGNVFRFINGASDNTIKFCSIQGENTSTTNATILFSTSVGATGNNNNTIDNCDITDDGISTPIFGVLSIGTAGLENSNNTISNCNIANYYIGSASSRGVFVSTANTGWTITGNRFYQTVARAYTSTAAQTPIAVVSTTGNGFTVSNNTIGYSSPLGTGTYTFSSSVATVFQGILMTVDDVTTSTVQGNTITNLNYTTTSGAMSGIAVTSGRVDVIGNTIGASTGNGAIVKTNSTTSSPAFMGISSTAATPGAVNIQNNNIGSITVNGSSATVGAGVYGISVTSTATATITGNIIGSVTTPNSIQSATVSTGTQLVYGIIATISSTTLAPPLISNNAIANLTAAGTGTASLAAGILFNSTSSGIITNNVIRNISSGSSSTTLTGQVGVSGIAYTGATGSATISQNTINTLIATNTGAVVSNVAGIGYTGSVNGSISGNRIYDLRNMSTGVTATTPPKAIGIFCYNPGTSATIVNNMISLGNSQTTNTAFTGIMQGGISSTALIKIYHNTINIEGASGSGTLATVGILRGNYSATSYTTPFDVRNNIVNNVRGGSGKHYAIANIINGTGSVSGWGANASNYNILNAGAANVGFWSGDHTFANWKVASVGDPNSFSASAVTFTNSATGDLHINMGVLPNNIEAHGIAIEEVTTDYDNQTRPGPTSVNGGGFAPDLGADEFDGVPNENIAPVISYTALLNACGTGNRTFTVNIVDPSGVPPAVTSPRVYYKKGLAGTWFSNGGTLSSGTVQNGVWSFTILSADMGGLIVGDQVFYYVVAQDVPGNIGSNPSGVVAANVNSIGTHPAAPNSYFTQQALGGSYDVGLSGAYTTITSAVAAYHSSCISGPVVFNLTDATYPSETFPITINSIDFSSPVNTLTIRPAAGVFPSITGSATPALIVLNGADYVIIDGSNNPVTNSVCPPVASSRDMTITNTSTSTVSAVVWLQTATGLNGATNNIIRNCNIFGSSNTQTLVGIGSGGTSVSVTGVGTGNNNNQIENNSINACQNGIYTRGASTANKNEGNIINQNVIAGTAPNNITENGILTGFENNLTVSGNHVANIANTASQDLVAISIGVTNNTILATTVTGAEVTNATVTYNTVDNIQTPTTANSTIGIAVFGSGSGTNTIANNMISNVGGKQTGTDLAAGIYLNSTLAGGTTNLFYNTVKISGTFTGGTVGSFGIAINGADPVVNIKNNIVLNDMLNGSLYRYAIGIGYPGATNISSDYNNFYIVGGNFGVVGSLTTAGVVSPTIDNWRTNTGYDLNSKNINPTFLSSSDLHISLVVANAGFMDAGTPIAVTTDMDCSVRSGTTPDIGADEFHIPNCTVPSAGVATADISSFCNAGVATITAVGPTAGIGTTYEWQASTDSVSWTTISGATTTSYKIQAPITTTTYYRIRVGCSFTSSFDSSTRKITVIPNPDNIAGPSTMCISSAYTLTSATPGGTWSSSDIGIATVTPGTGDVMTTATGGAANISYTMGNGCSAVKTIVVSPTLPVVTTSAAPATICAGESTTLNGGFTNPGEADYAINSISYAPETFSPTGTFTSMTPVTAGSLDDGFFTVVLPFDFSYYGTTYPAGSDAFIGVNGYMNFGTGTFLASNIGSIPNASYPATLSVLGMDLDLNYSGSITYGVTGTAPNRHFIISYNAVPDWRNDVPNTYFESGQIILHETSNDIEFHIGNALDLGPHSIGIQSSAGAQSSVVPGQNNVTSTVYASGWRFNSVQSSFNWVADPTLSATDVLAPTAGPLNSETTYTLSVTASNGCSAASSTTVSVNPLPASITGDFDICEGYSTTLANTSPGGTWTSSDLGVATVDVNSGVVFGVAPGTAQITYAFTGTGCNRVITLTVNQTPEVITGSAQVCVGATTTLMNADAGGTWTSGNGTIATIAAGTGVLTGVLAGTANITYELPTGCIRQTTVSVNPLPDLTVTPTTPTTFCIGESTSAYTANATMPGFSLLNQNFNGTLAGWTVESLIGPGSGQWQIVPTGFDFTTTGDGTAMLQASPAVAGAQIHSRIVSPSFSTVGYGTVTLTFNQYLLTDGADPTIAVQYSIDGGTAWLPLASYSGAFGETGTATWSAATPTATLPLPGGAINQPDVRIRWDYDASFYGWFLDNIKVNAELPLATYSWTGGGDLSCSTCTNPTITPASAGMNVYTVTATSSASCTSEATVTVNVNPLPSVITGSSFEVCVGQTTTLSNVDGGGTWTSGDLGVALVHPSTGVVLGVTAGTVSITYQLPTGCIRTTEVTVNPLPSVITGTAQACEGLTTTLSSGPSGGAWSSSNSNASVDGSGVVTGNTFGLSTITYTLPVTGCFRTVEVTINQLPTAITGNSEVCEGATITLGSLPAGGTWSSNDNAIATVDGSGVVTGQSFGNTHITYVRPVTGCIRTAEITVNPLPAIITGNFEVCEGLTTTLNSATGGGAWSSSNSNAAVDGAGVATGNTFGNATITYQLPVTGCIRTQQVTVNPLPSVISGNLEVCEGLTTALGSTPSGGNWTTSNGNTTIDGSGVVTGVAFGVSTITYELPVTGCIRTAEVTVNVLPAAITGNFEVCEGLTTMLSSGPSGGSWTSSNSNALVDGAGIVTGNTAGLSVITYELPATGCIRTQEVTVNALPSSITGNPEVCEGLTTALGSTPSGGVWSSSDVPTASVDGSGLVTGHISGVATITYELPVTGCNRTLEVTVNALPAAISGASQVCATSSITLMSSTPGGSWTSSDDAIADVDMVTGVVSGMTAGTATITYTLPTTCIATHVVTVNALPVVHNVTGGGSYCFSGAGVNVGLDNSETDNTYNLYLGSALMASQSGTGGAVDFGPMTAAGDYTVVATSSASCNRDMNGMATVTIIPLITPGVTLASAPGNTVCAGTSVTFTASPVNGGTTPAYSWMVNTVPVTTTTNVHTYTPVNGDVISVTMTSNEACPSPASVSATEVIVVVPNQTPTVSIATPNTTLCQGSLAVYSVSATTFGGTAPVYTWYRNNVSTGVTGSVYSYIPVDGDVISARMNSNYMCPIVDNVESNKITMNIDTAFVPVVAIRASTGLTIKVGQSVTFTATVTQGGGAPTYKWYINGTFMTGATNASYTTSAIKNNDSVSCLVYGTGQCSWYSFNTLKMKVTTGVDAVTSTEADIRLMPNPNSGEFAVKGTLATTNDAEVSLEITDMLGQIVYRNKVMTRGGILNEQVKLSNMLANGMYMLNVRSGADSRVFHFVLKQ